MVLQLRERIESGDYRSPPVNYEAEQALLGAILANNAAFEKVSDFLIPDHFAHATHGRIYAACGQLIERGQIADAVTLKGYFERDETLSEVGGAQYLAQLIAAVPSIINAVDYGKVIHDLKLFDVPEPRAPAIDRDGEDRLPDVTLGWWIPRVDAARSGAPEGNHRAHSL